MAFENLAQDVNATKEEDVLGGGKTFLVESGVYDTIIDMAYMDKSQYGADSFNVTFKGQNGEEIKQTIYVSNRQGETTYAEKDRKTGQPTGKRRDLPGFSVASAICKLSVGDDLITVARSAEPKTIKIFDFTAMKELPQEKQVLTALIGQPITLGMFKDVVDKNVKDGNGNWVPGGETREENDIGKVFRTRDGLTTVEVEAEATSHDFKDAWAEKHTGITRQKAKGKIGGTPGAPTGTTGGGETKSLFKK